NSHPDFFAGPHGLHTSSLQISSYLTRERPPPGGRDGVRDVVDPPRRGRRAHLPMLGSGQMSGATMKSTGLAGFCLALGTLLIPALAHAEVSCIRSGLQQAVDLYVAAQTKGEPSGLPLAKGLGYWENAAPADIQKGFITKPLKIDHQRSFFDTDTCQSFTELIVTD